MKTRKILSVFLACFLFLSVLQVPVLAEITDPAANKEEEHNHDYSYDAKIVSKPTCEKDGVIKRICECGAYRYERMASDHDWVVDREIRPATCTEPGLVDRHCNTCQKTETNAETPLIAHKWVVGVSDATCTEPMKAGEVCEVCGTAGQKAEVVEGTEPLGHSYERENPVFDVMESTPASCTVGGERILKCTERNCTGTSVEAVGALGHDYESDAAMATMQIQEPNCVSGGYLTITCGREDCNETTREEVDGMGEPLGHDMKKVKTIPATCEKDGGELYRCTRTDCDFEEVTGTVVKAYNHTDGKGNKTVTMKAVEATCATTGYSVEVCTRCGAEAGERTQTGAADPSKHLADPEKVVIVKAATCTVNGVKRDYCKYCNTSMGYSIDPAKHSWNEGVKTQEPTCATPGAVTYTCTVDGCNTTSEEAIAPTEEHEYEVTTSEADCTHPQRAGEFCKLCGNANPDAEMEDVVGTKPLGHDMTVEVEIATPVSCTADGVKVVKCSRCPVTEAAVIKSNGHDYDSEEALATLKITDPTCVSPGSLEIACGTCGEITREAVEGMEKLGHKWSEATKVAASCVSPASLKQSCDTCGEVSCSAIVGDGAEAAKNHSPENKVIEATCATSGYSVSVCKNCGEELSKTATTEADPSKHVADPEKAVIVKEADCTANGVKRNICKYCGKSAGYVVIPASHQWNEGERTQEPTCATPGAVTYTCTVDGCQAVSEEAIAATGEHQYEEKIVDPTCTEPQKIGNVCTVCGHQDGDIEEVEGTKPLGHEMTIEVEIATPVSCTADGVKVVKCSRCPVTAEAVIKSLGHEYDDENLEYHVSTDCAVSDYITHACKNCHEVTNEALGTEKEHTWGEEETIQASCTAPGGIYHTCSVCGKKELAKGQETPALSHSYNTATTVAATCATSGYSVNVCDNCGKEDPDGQKTNIVDPDPTKHVKVDGEIVQQPTCSKNGVVRQVCKECGKNAGFRALPMTDHTWGEVETKAPTCSEEGEERKTCQECGTSEVTMIPKIAHEMAEDDIMNDDASVIWNQCKNCDYIVIQFSMVCEVAGHQPKVVTDEAVAPTETTPGKTVGYHCGTCGHILIPQEEVSLHEHVFDVLKDTIVNEDGSVTTVWGCSVGTCTATYEESSN